MISLVGVAFNVAALSSSTAGALPHQDRLQLVDCKATNVYGVPIKLTQVDVRKLGFRYKMGMEQGSEGGSVRTFDIVAEDGVVVTAVFSLIDGGLLFLRTTSDKAADPKGVKIGDSLEDVRKAWPDGGLQLPTPGEEGITEPRYLTTSNVSLSLGEKAGGGNALFVKAIEIVDFVPFEGLPSWSCPG